ncbi:MAG: hydroxymethylglutaryl-CoA reductase [Rickettsiaceae bacterium]|nr:hydroxymethylglutaryl-CoA reductase [Rickettsiaceae bacterium]
MSQNQFTLIPTRNVGPIKISGEILNEQVTVPMATFEKPLWYSASRGASVSRNIPAGINLTLVKENMTRSCVMEGGSASEVIRIHHQLQEKSVEIAELIAKTSRFAKFESLHTEPVGNLLYLRLAINPGQASGHNMVTKAADMLISWLQTQYKNLKYVSISANFCTDKKTSAVNGIMGRGKHIIAETVIPYSLCKKLLHVTPEQLVNLHIKKNLIGSILAGSVRSANSHVANTLLACYLATGQDAANIVEGSQAIIHTELQNDDLYFSLSMPNIIVGTIGNGKDSEISMQHLKQLKCIDTEQASVRLAAIITATALCTEISCIADQCIQGKLMTGHLAIERKITNV